MEVLIEFGKILLPAGAVLYAMYLIVKSFLDKELERQALLVRGKSIETVLPNRLHAYERICLFLERISPNNLVVRLNNGDYTAREFQHIMLKEVREEYNHNVSQQVYMSDEVWDLVKTAKEELIVSINESAMGLDDEATGLDLSKRLFDTAMDREFDPIQKALIAVKAEIRTTF
ncbi:MAG: hypothetical protein AAF519_10200 [Bacteroidota bacterium]